MDIQIFGMSHLIGLLRGIVADDAPDWQTALTKHPACERPLPLIAPWQDNIRLTATLITPTSDFVPAFQTCKLATGTSTFLCHPNLHHVLSNFLSATDGKGTLVSLLNGHDHSVLSLIQHPSRYDFVLPTHPDLPLDSTAQVLPYRTIARQVREQVAPTIDALALLRAFWPDANICHVLPPPPVASAEHILAQKEAIVGECRAHGVSSPYLRLKYYFECQAQLTSALGAMNIATFAAPAGTLDGEGFLAADYYWDATHGNPGYGNRQFMAIVDRLG
jgi:hypothetical protein